MEQTIEKKFGHYLTTEQEGSQIKLVELKKEASALANADAVVGGTMEQVESWHYPPVRHDFCMGEVLRTN